MTETVILWRPIGPEELKLIEEAQMRAFPPRLPEQPIFYPVLTEDYAVKIARDWNVPSSGSGYVTRFAVRKDFLDGYAVQEAGGRGASRILDSRRGTAPLSMMRSSARSKSSSGSAESDIARLHP
jgi:hypothetical protein